MVTNKGFQPIPRTWFNSVQWLSKRTFDQFDALVWLLESAAYVDGRRVQISANRTITLRRGQIATTMSAIAERWGWNKGTVSRFLRKFSHGGAFEYSPVISTEVIRNTTPAATVGASKYGSNMTLITICNYEEIVNMSNAVATVGTTVSATVEATVGATSIYSIETKNKESYKKRENECVKRKKDAHAHTPTQKFNNQIVSTTDCVVGAAQRVCDDEKIAATASTEPMKSVDDFSEEKENVAPKEKEGGGAVGQGAPVSDTFAIVGATARELVVGNELLQWFNAGYPDLAAMKYPMTLEQAVWLLRSYSVSDIRFIIDRMRSKEVFRNNTVFYSTFVDFARRDKNIVRKGRVSG